MEQLLHHKHEKLRKELIDESEYLSKIKRDIEAEKQKDKDAKARKAKDQETVLEENAKAEKIREKQRQVELAEDVRLAEFRQ